MPLGAPGKVIMAFLVFVNSWNVFLLALSFNTPRNMRTMPVGVTLYRGS